MKKIIVFCLAFLLLSTSILFADSSSKEGSITVAAHLDVGKNQGDSIAQLGGSIEYGIIPHLSAELEWQFPFGLFLAIQGGADLEGSDWGYVTGGALGYRF